MSYNLLSEDYLAHHGILGQKWGKRNGPPYPLGQSAHSASEKKAGWKKSLDKGVGGSYDTRKRGLTAQQKKAILAGVAVVATGLAVYGLYRTSAIKTIAGNGKVVAGDILGISGDYSAKGISANTENDNTIVDPVTGLKRKINFKLPDTLDGIRKECVAGINPSGSRTNCGSCAVAAVLRTFGYDVEALSEVPEHMRNTGENGMLGNGYDLNKLLSVFGNPEPDSLDGNFMNRNDAMLKTISKLEACGEGACGLLWTHRLAKTDPPSGHYMAWRVVNGQAIILEGQPSIDGIVRSGVVDICENVGQHLDPNSTSWVQIDPAMIDPSKIMDIVKNK